MELSIIIPIYNSEKYLPECLNSLCSQIKNNNVEIILIDDNSSDKSLNICRKYKKKFKFIKLVIFKVNKGVSVCRNKGIKIASGKYISFVDSDDKLENGSIKLIINKLNKYSKSDILVIRSKEIFSNVIDKNQFLKLPKKSNKKSIITFIDNFDKFRATCWNFILKKDFITSNDIYFKKIITYEDQVFVSEILCYAKSFEIINKAIYLWRIFEPNTLGKKSGYVVAMSCVKIIYEISNFIQQNEQLKSKKIKFLFSRLNFVIDQFLLHIIICNAIEIKKISKYLNNCKSLITKLPNFKNKKINHFIHSNIEKRINKFKFNKFLFLTNKIKNFRKNNFILFCAGGYGEIVLKAYHKIGLKIDFIIDNNPQYSGKKLYKYKIQKPSFIKKNIQKYFNHTILISNTDIKVYNEICYQLTSIGIKKNQIMHIKI